MVEGEGKQPTAINQSIIQSINRSIIIIIINGKNRQQMIV
jgi:hypothetical protein